MKPYTKPHQLRRLLPLPLQLQQPPQCDHQDHRDDDHRPDTIIMMMIIIIQLEMIMIMKIGN